MYGLVARYGPQSVQRNVQMYDKYVEYMDRDENICFGAIFNR